MRNTILKDITNENTKTIWNTTELTPSEKVEYFADALKRAGKDFIPTNCIINKLLPGLGLHCELTAQRKSIIIEPNVPVIESKTKKHKNALAVYKGVTIRR